MLNDSGSAFRMNAAMRSVFLVLMVLTISFLGCKKSKNIGKKMHVISDTGLSLLERVEVVDGEIRGQSSISIPSRATVTVIDEREKVETINGVRGTFFKISYEGSEGWAFSADLSSDEPTTDCPGRAVYMRCLESCKTHGPPGGSCEKPCEGYRSEAMSCGGPLPR